MLVAGVVLGGLTFATPTIARWILLSKLANAGYPHATIDHVGVGWDTATITNFDLTGAGQAMIQRVTTDWSLAEMIVSGVIVRLPSDDFSPLMPGPHSPDTSGSSTWPIGRVTVSDATIVVGERQGQLSATVVRLEPDQIQVSVTARDGGAGRIVVDGTVGMDGDLDLHAKIHALPVAMLRPRNGLEGINGTATGELRLVHERSTWTVDGPFSVEAAACQVPWIGQVLAQNLSGRFRWDGTLTGDVAVTAAQLSLLGVPITVPSARLMRDSERLELRARAQAMGADLNLDGHASPDLSAISGNVRATGLDLAAAVRLLRPWYTLPVDAIGVIGIDATVSRLASAWQGRATVTFDDLRLATTDGATRVTMPTATAELTYAVIDGAPSGTAVLRVTHGQVHAPGIDVASVDGTLPWSLNTDPQLDGSLQFSDVTIGGFPMRQLAAHVRGVDRRIGGAANFAVLDRGQGRVDGWYDLTKRGGTFGVVVPRFTIVDPASVRSVLPALGQRDITGEVDLSGTVVIADGRITPELRVSLNDGVVADPLAKLTVNGLSAMTTITGFVPLATSGTRQVVFRSATIGSLTFGDGIARVSAHLPEGLNVTEASIAWCGGRLNIPDLDVDLVHHRASGTIGLNHLSLGALLQATVPRQLTGQGLISGRVPLTLTWPDYLFSFGAGSIAADPATGWLHLTDRTALTSSIATGFATVDAQIVDTVADLVFDDLRVDIVPESPLSAVAKVHVSGHGRTGDPPLAIGGLDVNLRGLERALAEALFMQRWQTSPETHPVKDDTIDRFFSH